MKKGKIILSLAAGIVTIGSSFAFKVAHKFSGAFVLVQEKNALGANVTCKTCINNQVTTSLLTEKSCVTHAGGLAHPGAGSLQHTFFLNQTQNVGITCINPTIQTDING